MLRPGGALRSKSVAFRYPLPMSLSLVSWLPFLVSALAVPWQASSATEQPARTLAPSSGIIVNPQATYSFLGNGYLGRALGLERDSALQLGGFLLPEFDWVVSGGVEPDTAYGSLALGLHAKVDLEKALHIPGATWGVEFLATTGGDNNEAAGTVQMYTNMDGDEPRDRQEMMQLWWLQRLFDDKVLVQVGKLNGSGIFNTVLNPVIVDTPWMRDATISDLIMIPIGLNPTLFGRLPAYYNTAYGAVVHLAPTTNFYASLGIFDGNGATGVQTGKEWLPTFNEYTFNIAEVGYSWRLGAEGKPGRLGLGGWWQTGDLYTPALNVEDGAQGYYLFANQRLWFKNPGIDNAGLIGYLQFGHTGSATAIVNTYLGAGLTGIGLIPGRHEDTLSLGLAYSELNDTTGAGAFFFPDVPSPSVDLGASELMVQAAYETNFAFGTPANYWTLTSVLAYSFIPDPGQRPDLPAAHVVSWRLIALF